MSLKLEHNSHITAPAFTYPALPQEPYTTRMIRLLAHKDKSAPIQCVLFNYDLSETGGGTHLYQALSYVWGSEVKPESIILNGCTFHVTTNLHSALVNLRNRQLDRVLWVDAICINQDDEDQGNEKSKQIPLMRTIYAQAERVIVWLGETTANGDQALESIRCLGEGQDTTSSLDNPESYDACLQLLQRDWFSRIWVLQEVGVARCVYIMCGPVSINGHVFCEGLSRLGLSSDFRSRIGPVAYLIKGALYRPKYELGSRGSISVGELIGMYQNHNATKQHDKIYALLGLSANPITAALEPNYSLPWKEVFKQVVNHIFPECSVDTWNGTATAVIKGKGLILGNINSVEESVSEFGKQNVEVLFNDNAQRFGFNSLWETNWKPQASAVLIQAGDIICLLKGASKPSIIRLCRDHFIVVIPAVTPQKRQDKESPAVISPERLYMSDLHDILLTWKIPDAKPERKDKSEVISQLSEIAPNYREEWSYTEKRLKHTRLAVLDIAMTILKQGKFETKAIEQLLRQSGTKDPIIKELVMDSAHEDRRCIETLPHDLFFYQENDLPFSEDMVIAVATNYRSRGCIIVEILLQHQRASLPVSEEVVKVVAESLDGGNRIMEVLFRHQGNNLLISEEVVKAAAGNMWVHGPQIMEVLLQQQGKSLPVSEQVVKAAAENRGPSGPGIMEVLFQCQGENLPVSENVVRAAAGNSHHGPEILEILFQHRGESLPVSEEVVQAAAGNSHRGYQIMMILIQHRGKSLPVSEEVVKAAAENREPSGPAIMEVLFQRQGENLPVSEKVVRAAVRNSCWGPEILETLFQHRGKSLPVSEETVKAAAGNSHRGYQIMMILIQHRGKNLPVSEKAVKAVAGNRCCGPGLIEALFQHLGENLPVSEEVVKAAAGNNAEFVPEILRLILIYRAKSPPIYEAVLKTAGNLKIELGLVAALYAPVQENI